MGQPRFNREKEQIIVGQGVGQPGPLPGPRCIDGRDKHILLNPPRPESLVSLLLAKILGFVRMMTFVDT